MGAEDEGGERVWGRCTVQKLKVGENRAEKRSGA